GEKITAEDLGGARVHASVSGNAHFTASSEEEVLQMVRRLLSFLPQNNQEQPPRGEPVEDDGWIEELIDLVPVEGTKVYDMREVILRVVDNGDFMEVQERFARNIVVGFARLNGYPVGIVANQPKVMAGGLDIDSSDKLARFVRFCDAFNIPIITF